MRLGKLLQIQPIAFQGEDARVALVTTERLSCLRKTSSSPAALREPIVVAALHAYQPFVPEYLGEDSEGRYYSLMDGLNLAWLMESASPEVRTSLAAQLGVALQTIHQWQPPLAKPAKPWLSTTLSRLPHSHSSVIDDPYSPFRGTTYAALRTWTESCVPEIEPRVAFCHGDACLPNFLSDGSQVIGAVDWGDGNWADPRFDLATALWSLRRNSPQDPKTETYLNTFLDAYGWAEGLEGLSFFEALYTLWE